MTVKTFQNIAILNRGEAATRFQRGLRDYNLERGTAMQATVFYTDPDAGAPFVQRATHAVALGAALQAGPDGRLRSAYLDAERIVGLLVQHGCDAVWPGWGFLSEDAAFVSMLEAAGVTFIGPPSTAMNALGDKAAAKSLAIQAGVPLAPWADIGDFSPDAISEAARGIGYPLMVKASAGGGGRGIRKVEREADLLGAVASVKDEVARVFGAGTVIIERCITGARHVEIQVVAGADGAAMGLGVRDCSVQRRHQKVIEEAPCPILPPDAERLLLDSSARMAELAGYRGVCTAEFLWQPQEQLAAFLEVNARLQVEHTITELVTGADLVHAQIDIARGLAWRRPERYVGGHAIEVRLCAEDPDRDCAPAPGLIRVLDFPNGPGIRVDSGIEQGMVVAPEFDSMVAKVMAWGPDRKLALARMRRALHELDLVIEEGAHNKAMLLALFDNPAVVDATADTQWLDRALAAGDLMPVVDPTPALITAAILAHTAETEVDVHAFFSAAQSGMPRTIPAPATRGFDFRIGRASTHVDIDDTGPDTWTVVCGHRQHHVRFQVKDAASATLEVGPVRHRILWAVGPTATRIDVDGRTFAVVAASGNGVRTPAPALVVRVDVAPGDEVQAGQRLATLEAMKLESPLLADRAGRIAQVLCRPHQQVTAGQVLFVLEAAGAETAEEEVVKPLERADRPLWRLADGAQAHPARLDALPETEATAVIRDLVSVVRGVLLGWSLPEDAATAVRGLTRIDLDFTGLKQPERWLPLLELLEDFVAVEACFEREPMDDSARGTTVEFAFFDFCRRLHLGDLRTTDALKQRLLRALGRYGVTTLSGSVDVREALWRMALARRHSELRYRCASTLLRAIIGLQGVGVSLDGALSGIGVRPTLVEVLRLAPASLPAVGDNAHQALLALELAPRWEAHRASQSQGTPVEDVTAPELEDRAALEALLAATDLPAGVDHDTAIRLELWRYQHFIMTRLPAPEPLLVLNLRARENPDDERIIVLADVADAPDTLGSPADPRLVPFEIAWLEATRLLRQEQSRRDARKRLHNNRMVLFFRNPLRLKQSEMVRLGRRYEPQTRGLGLEKVVIHARLVDPRTQAARPLALVMHTVGRHRLQVAEESLTRDLVRPLDRLGQRRVAARRLGVQCPYDIMHFLQHRGSAGMSPHVDLLNGKVTELDLDASGDRLVPVSREPAMNTCGVVVALVRHQTRKHPDGMERVLLLSDPLKAMGALGEPECRRILAAFDLADERGVPIEWLPVSSGARIAMDSGTENLDWTARVLRRIVEFTAVGGTVNIIVAGTCVGAQSYWNAMATMLLHTRGVLIMTPEAAMVLTGKRALEASGSVAAEDERGIGGYDRIMGPNGEAAYLARDVGEAWRILFDHYALTYSRRGELPRHFGTGDPDTRDVMESAYPSDDTGFRTIGEIFDEKTNPGRKRPFSVRAVLHAAVDQDGGVLERWAGWRDAETAVILDAHMGGVPVTVIGIESKPLPRSGQIPSDGPDTWSGGTLFPQSSKKVARALRVASGVRPAVVLANLSGFDGSPESMRRAQLELGAEIGRAVVEFEGPIIFCVIGRYHGGAYVVFSKGLNPRLQALAVEGSFASVIGGAPAAAVVFPRDVKKRVDADPRVVAARQTLEETPPAKRPRLREKLEALLSDVTLEKQAEVAKEFDAIHSVERAVRVGSLDAVIAARNIRPAIIERLRKALRPLWSAEASGT